MLIAPSAYPLGGVATWLDYLVPGLRAAGWQVSLALSQGHFHNVERYLAEHYLTPVMAVHCGTGTRESRIRRLSRAITDVAPDIIAFTNIPDACLAVGRLRSQGAPVGRVVMLIHGFDPDAFRDMRTLARSLDAVICANRLACALSVSHFGMDYERVFYAPCGTLIPERGHVPDRPFGRVLRLAFVSRLERATKRVQDLVGLVQELARRQIEFELNVVGSGPDEEELRNRMRCIAPKRVRFLGRVPHPQLSERVYDHADALVITSSSEAGPIVAWEAMASGVAVITSRYLGSGREGSLRHRENCLMFSVGDVAAAADCVELLRNAAIRKRILQRGFELAEQHYSQQASLSGWQSAFQKVLDLPKLPPNGGSFNLQAAPAGRIDRVVGSHLAETIRRCLGISYRHTSPGGEWPHTLGVAADSNENFWSVAAELDAVSHHEVSA